MLTTTANGFRKNIKKYFDDIVKNNETLIINRGEDAGVVVISLEEYNKLRSTPNELPFKENAKK